MQPLGNPWCYTKCIKMCQKWVFPMGMVISHRFWLKFVGWEGILDTEPDIFCFLYFSYIKVNINCWIFTDFIPYKPHFTPNHGKLHVFLMPAAQYIHTKDHQGIFRLFCYNFGHVEERRRGLRRESDIFVSPEISSEAAENGSKGPVSEGITERKVLKAPECQKWLLTPHKVEFW